MGAALQVNWPAVRMISPASCGEAALSRFMPARCVMWSFVQTNAGSRRVLQGPNSAEVNLKSL